MPTEILPDPVMVRETINFRQAGIGSDARTLRVILDKEVPLARENGRDLDDVEDQITETVIDRNLSDDLPTKVLESAVLDTTDRIPFPFADVLVNLWIYYASIGKYTGVVYVTHPQTGERLQLSPLNALILFFYTFNKGYALVDFKIGETPVNIPQFIARIIPRQVVPAIAGLPAKPTEPDDFNEYVNRTLVTDATLQEIIGEPMLEQTYVSSDDFYVGATAIHDELMRRYRVYTSQSDMVARGHAEYAVSMMYWSDVPCTLVDEAITFDQWLALQAIDFTGMQTIDYRTMADELLRNGTGMGENANRRLRDLQTAMIEVMRRFSSYSVQYMKSINDSATLVVDWKTLRTTNEKMEWFAKTRAGRIPVGTIKFEAHRREQADAGLFGANIANFPDLKFKSSARISVGLSVRGKGKLRTNSRVIIPTVQVLEVNNLDTDLNALIPNNVLNGFNYIYWNSQYSRAQSSTPPQTTLGSGFTILTAGSGASSTPAQLTEGSGPGDIENAGNGTSRTPAQETSGSGYAIVNMGSGNSRNAGSVTEGVGIAHNHYGSGSSSNTGKQLTRGGVMSIYTGDGQSSTPAQLTEGSEWPDNQFMTDGGSYLMTDGGDFFVLE